MVGEDVKVKIGLEIHVPLKAGRKLFCDCPTNYWDATEPNINTCPVCTGMPGSKPYPLNSYALDTVVMIARLLECKVVTENIFVKRKHYDYPDLPSGYQRTSEPVGLEGNIDGVGIWEVHLEEDPGRYDLKTGCVDYNRSGVPLIEIVSAPDMKGPDDVRSFMREMVNMLRYTERIVDVGGVMRADVNISIEGGAKVEIKNINSVQGAFKAVQYEIVRQKNMMRRGAAVIQETRGFDEKTMVTVSQRLKETAADYRFIPDPDIPPLLFEGGYVEGIKLPETPQLRRKRIIADYGIREDYALTMVRDKDIADFFEQVAKDSDTSLASAWICREVLKQLNYRNKGLRETSLDAGIFSELLSLIASKKITEHVGKKLFERIIDSGESPTEVVEAEGLGSIDDSQKIMKIQDEVNAKNPQAFVDILSGSKKAENFLVGQVMRETRGAANQEIVLKNLSDTIQELRSKDITTLETIKEHLECKLGDA
ncbi:Asp-tRNA(Asn)/Glu-tRNA(Gln) amidotransferase subunit GatB [Candidatus Altiarchaeota archaeon]